MKECSVRVPQFGKEGKHVGGCYDPATHQCCTGPNLDPARPAPMSWVCRKTEVCLRTRCLPACPPRTKKCGKTCCTSKQQCRNGTCTKCSAKQEECGAKCCAEDQFCCTEKNGGICCSKKVCCIDPGEASARCCPVSAPRCGKQSKPRQDLPAWGDPVVCCPDDRWAFIETPENGWCCPPGEKALKRPGLVVGPSGFTGCCPEPQFCGPAGRRTCCQSGLPPSQRSSNELCCDGVCRKINVDPNNCGACGVNCLPGEFCVDGVCE